MGKCEFILHYVRNAFSLWFNLKDEVCNVTPDKLKRNNTIKMISNII